MTIKERATASLVMSAAGDALGWPYEFTERQVKREDSARFVTWRKRIGGKYWGFVETIEKGSYSDDTQLSLGVARSIDHRGNFQPEHFAYLELPLWLHYERGGGKTLKTAARNLLKKTKEWNTNFFNTKEVSYKMAGANGAAMRVLPIAIANVENFKKLLKNVFESCIITHGHPRAILGAMLYAAAVAYLFRLPNGSSSFSTSEFCSFLQSVVDESLHVTLENKEWVSRWEKAAPDLGKWEDLFSATQAEARDFLKALAKHLHNDERVYYKIVGAFKKELRGSGLSTVCAALFTMVKNVDNPWKGISRAATTIGSDTDTIAGFVGGLMGAIHGEACIPGLVKRQLQDVEYLVAIAERLAEIGEGKYPASLKKLPPKNRQEILLKIAAWELGLREMFWDAIGEGGEIDHPVLGRGVIIKKEVKELGRPGYVAKLLRVRFNCGQSCVFHSRVATEGRISESLVDDLKKNLEISF